MRIGWTAQGITSLPSSTLPRTFTPPIDDLGGNAFVVGGCCGGGVWAGERGIINFFGNGPVPAGGYSPNPGAWGAVRIEFAQPVRSVGFSFQQAELPTQLSIDGAARGTLRGLFGFPTNGQRAGYPRIAGTGGDTISFIDLFNNRPTGRHGQGGCDGWMIDYLALTFRRPASFRFRSRSRCSRPGSVPSARACAAVADPVASLPGGRPVRATGTCNFTCSAQRRSPKNIRVVRGNVALVSDPSAATAGRAAARPNRAAARP